MATGKVIEAAAVALPDLGSRAKPCWSPPFWQMARNRQDALAEELSGSVVTGLGKAFQPKQVLFVDDLPKTRSLKIMRRVIRALVLDENPGDLTALTNPDAIEAVRRAAEAD